MADVQSGRERSAAGGTADNPAALEVIEELFPTVGLKRLEALRRVDPEFCRMFQDFVYGGLYRRAVLDQRVRELCALAALAVVGKPTQLRSHIRAAFLAGATWAEVTEVFIQVTAYAGFPAAIGALDLLEEFRVEFGPPADEAPAGPIAPGAPAV